MLQTGLTHLPGIGWVDQASIGSKDAAACARRTTERDRGRLTKRERECLLLAACGKSDWEMSKMLGLSERTVHHAIEKAKTRFGVTTRVQAIVHAIAIGEFSAADAMR